MLTDALVQLLVFKRWTKILLVSGPDAADGLYAESLRRSARKFGARVVAETKFDARGADLRDSALREFALATRGPEHDVVAVADEAGEFGTNLVFNTESPRPVVGTQGLSPAAWPGGRGLGRRAAAGPVPQARRSDDGAYRLGGLDGRPRGGRGGGEAPLRRSRGDRQTDARSSLRGRRLQGPAPELPALERAAAPAPLPALAGAVVAAAPVEGFLHRATELDTLGLDRPESACKVFGG